MIQKLQSWVPRPSVYQGIFWKLRHSELIVCNASILTCASPMAIPTMFPIPGFYIFRCHIFSRGAARTILPALAVIIARAKECYVQTDCVRVRVAE